MEMKDARSLRLALGDRGNVLATQGDFAGALASSEAGRELPEDLVDQMEKGLVAFIEGKIRRISLAALLRNSRSNPTTAPTTAAPLSKEITP